MMLMPQYIENALAISSSKKVKHLPFILLQSSATPITPVKIKERHAIKETDKNATNVRHRMEQSSKSCTNIESSNSQAGFYALQ